MSSERIGVEPRVGGRGACSILRRLLQQVAALLAFGLVLGCNLTFKADLPEFDEDGGVDADEDTAEPPADTETDAVDDDADGGVVAGVNSCGGLATLLLNGEQATPLQRCGECGTGEVVCAGGDALRCEDSGRRNVCGGCEVLTYPPGEECGFCGGGQAQCDEFGGSECLGATPRNGCGGCSVLVEQPGTQCYDDGQRGRWICDSGGESVSCLAGEGNECGGSEPLEYRGESAGVGGTCSELCGAGVLVCDGVDRLRCDSDVGENACGGCGALIGVPGESCGTCGGTWVCSEDGNVVDCAGAVRNACGGCSELPAAPGTDCGELGMVWQCGDAGEVLCASLDEPRPCESGAGVEGAPGDRCGTCESGWVTCDEGSGELVCTGDGGDAALNACGGCAILGAPVGSPCGTCGAGTWECDGTEALQCVDGGGGTNACGGCAELDAEVETSCGTCGTWACAGIDAVVCEGDTMPPAPPCAPSELNPCGGCTDLAVTLGDSCSSACGSGTWRCTHEGEAECVGVGDNACGGCAGLPSRPGTACSTSCGDGVWVCDGVDAVACDAPPVNRCGGCAELTSGEEPGDACSTACGVGVWSCAGDGESLSCSALSPNVCGGCAPLASAPGSACGAGDCGEIVCFGIDSVRCDLTGCGP